MRGFWITFTDGSKGYCEGRDEYDAKIIAEHFTGKKVGGGEWRDFAMESLPYPANPIIWRFKHPIHGECPAFCTSPEQCKGLGSCPQPRACTE